MPGVTEEKSPSPLMHSPRLAPPFRCTQLNCTRRATPNAWPPKAAANSADDEIVRLVRSGAQPQEIRVVTSDKALTDRVRDLGAAVYPAERFRDLIDPRGSNAARRTQ